MPVQTAAPRIEVRPSAPAQASTGKPKVAVRPVEVVKSPTSSSSWETTSAGLTSARTTEEMLKLVPHSLREGALALGAPQWRVILGVVIPAAAPGIATGAMLAIARVSGETAPLLFTAFGSRFFPESLKQPIASLTVQIYNKAI